jgi:hypothetical protein
MGLTPREKEIERMVRRGWTSREIADHLGIARRTVEAHRLNMRRRQRTVREDPDLKRSLESLRRRVSRLAAELAHLRNAAGARHLLRPTSPRR